MSKAETHATAPAYQRHRKDRAAIIARAEKKEEKLARKKAPKPKVETPAQRFEKKIEALMGLFILRRTEKKWTPGQLRHHEALLRQKARREPDWRKRTKAPYRRWKRKVRARIAARSRAVNRSRS